MGTRRQAIPQTHRESQKTRRQKILAAAARVASKRAVRERQAQEVDIARQARPGDIPAAGLSWHGLPDPLPRLLIVEDNERLAALMADGLSARGYTCDCAGSLQLAETALDRTSYDGMILDVELPDGNGLEWLRGRRGGRLPPFTLVVTALSTPGDRADRPDAGVDDYLSKPFDMDELVSRIRALLRRPGARRGPLVEAGQLRLDVSNQTASFAGQALDLSPREADLLELLIRGAGSVVDRALIEARLRTGDGAVPPGAVEAAMSQLRRKLERAGGEGILHMVKGVGYLLRETMP